MREVGYGGHLICELRDYSERRQRNVLMDTGLVSFQRMQVPVLVIDPFRLRDADIAEYSLT